MMVFRNRHMSHSTSGDSMTPGNEAYLQHQAPSFADERR
jgi:hypothetical protein